MSIKNTLIATCLVLLLIVVVPFLYHQNSLQSNSAVETPSIKICKGSLDPYKVVIDNNIFRLLGWKPSKKEPKYTLIGTTVLSDGSNAKAFILERRSNQITNSQGRRCFRQC